MTWHDSMATHMSWVFIDIVDAEGGGAGDGVVHGTTEFSLRRFSEFGVLSATTISQRIIFQIQIWVI